MIRTTHAVRGAAVIGALALALTACGNDDGNGNGTSPTSTGGGGGDSAPLIIGSLLPVTGNLSSLGPPEIAGVDLAIQEINEAGGTNGVDVEVIHTDSGDAENAAVATGSVEDLMSRNAHVIIGAASSSVTFTVIDTITEAGIVQISPANTSPGLSGYSEFYFRTAPPDSVQGSALANLIAQDGHSSAGFLVFNDDYGTGLRDATESTLNDLGVDVTYGANGEAQEFQPKQANYDGDVTAIMSTNPDAIVIIAFEETQVIVPQLAQAGFDTSKLYMVDGNTQSFEETIEAGVLEGSKGTIPGANPSDEFRERLLGVDPALVDYSYAAESYDAVILAALAAVKGGANDSQTVRDNMHAVSGSNGGEVCTSFADCVELIDAGEDIIYEGQAGVGPFNDDNDPSTAFIGIYVFDNVNAISWTAAVFGEVG